MIYYSIVKYEELVELEDLGFTNWSINNKNPSHDDYDKTLHYAKLRILKAELYRWIIIPIDILFVILSLWIYNSKWKDYRTKKNSISFEDYPEKIKSAILNNTICMKCGNKELKTFISEIDLQGVKMLELECQKCLKITKTRKPI